MRRLILGVALAGVTTSVAIIAQSQLKEDPGANEAEVVSAREVSRDTLALPNASDTSPAPVPMPVPTPTPVPVPAPAINEDQQPTGAKVLKAAAAAYSRVTTLQASFTQKRENPLLSSITNSRGTLYQKRPDRFLMKFSQPAGDMILSDGRYFWVYYPSADRKQVIRADARQGAAGGVDLQAQFLGDPLKRFTHTYHGLQNGQHVLTMVPRTNVGYKSLKVWIDAKDSLVRRFILTENNGVVVEIALSGLVVNKPLSNDLFRFTPPAGAQVISP